MHYQTGILWGTVSSNKWYETPFLGQKANILSLHKITEKVRSKIMPLIIVWFANYWEGLFACCCNHAPHVIELSKLMMATIFAGEQWWPNSPGDWLAGTMMSLRNNFDHFSPKTYNFDHPRTNAIQIFKSLNELPKKYGVIQQERQRQLKNL